MLRARGCKHAACDRENIERTGDVEHFCAGKGGHYHSSGSCSAGSRVAGERYYARWLFLYRHELILAHSGDGGNDTYSTVSAKSWGAGCKSCGGLLGREKRLPARA